MLKAVPRSYFDIKHTNHFKIKEKCKFGNFCKFERQLHGLLFAVCDLWAGGIIGPCFRRDVVLPTRWGDTGNHGIAQQIFSRQSDFTFARIGTGRPAWFCDLNPLDFFLWGCLESKVYRGFEDRDRTLHLGTLARCLQRCDPELR